MKKVLAWNLGLLLALAVVAELVFGTWFRGDGYGTLLLPRNLSYRFDVSNLYGRQAPVAYTRDRHGLRGSYDDLSQIGILTLGGSTTNQLYLDDAETWQTVLADRFHAAGRAVAVVNAGVDGQSTFGHLAVFDRWFPQIPDLKARYVLAYVGINDIGLDKSTKFDSMKSPEWDKRIRYYILNNSALYNLFRTVRGMLRASSHKVIHGESPLCGTEFVPGPGRDEVLPPPAGHEGYIAGYRARVKGLIGRIREFGAEPILVSQPTAEYRFDGDRVLLPVGPDGRPQASGYAVMMAYNRALIEECRAAGAICLDAGREVAFEPCDFYDRIHFDNAGARKLAEFLYSRLKNLPF